MSRRGVRDNRCPVETTDERNRREGGKARTRTAAETIARPDVMRARFARAAAAAAAPHDTRKPRSTQKRRAIRDDLRNA